MSCSGALRTPSLQITTTGNHAAITTKTTFTCISTWIKPARTVPHHVVVMHKKEVDSLIIAQAIWESNTCNTVQPLK